RSERPDGATGASAAGRTRLTPHPLSATALAVGSALLTVKPVMDACTHFRFLTQHGLGFATEISRWSDAEITHYLRAHPPHGPVYANCIAPFFLVSGMPLRQLPLRPRDGEDPRRVPTPDQLRRYFGNDGNTYVAWFQQATSGVYTIEDLRSLF